MRFKISLAETPSHTTTVTAVGWSSTEEVYSIGDDHQLLSWSVSNNQSTKIAQLNAELFPTDLHFIPRVGGAVGKHGDLILVTSADGKFYIMNKNGRIERTIEAHKGAILVGQWGNDGASFLTAGEDGSIKIWSRSGMLRSTVVTSDFSIYSACWSPDSQSIAYTQEKLIIIKSLAPNTKPIQWRAHESIVLSLAWSRTSELIISGGEDCKYRVWDSQGRQLFSSGSHNNPITSVAWSPKGDLFAVGSYDTLRLCDSLGWSRSLEKPTTGCIYKLSWSSDGTQLAGASANGHVLFAHVIERRVHYLNYSATVTEKKTVQVQDVINDSIEELELSERVIQMAMRYTHLVITTPSQCYIYSTSNWNTPTIFDLKDGSVILLLLCEKHMLLAEKTNVGLYNYQGRLIASPRWPNMRQENLQANYISLSPDTLVVRDIADTKIVYVIDLESNRNMSNTTDSFHHSLPILQISLDQSGPSLNRCMAFIDKTRDLYVTNVRTTHKEFSKLGGQVQSMQWNTEENMLAVIQDTRLVIYYCPTSSFIFKMLRLCSYNYDSPELGRAPKINDFVGNSVSVRRTDGSLVNVPISPFTALLHNYIQDNKWNDALNLCRRTNDRTLWACLAVLATQSNNNAMEVAEEAFAEIDHYDKVFYIQYIKELPVKAQQMAGMALLGGYMQKSESILLQNGMVYQAIYNHIIMHNWNRALDLATKHKTHVDTVIYMRKNYLYSFGKEEINNKFINLIESVNIDETKIKERMQQEAQKNFAKTNDRT